MARFGLLRLVLSGELFRERCVYALGSIRTLVEYACKSRSAIDCVGAVSEARFLPVVPMGLNHVLFLAVLVLTAFYVTGIYNVVSTLDDVLHAPIDVAGVIQAASLAGLTFAVALMLYTIILDGAWSALYLYEKTVCADDAKIGEHVSGGSRRATGRIVLDFSPIFNLLASMLGRLREHSDNIVYVDVASGSVDGNLDDSSVVVVKRRSRIRAILYRTGKGMCSTVTIFCPEAVCMKRTVHIKSIPPSLGLVLFDCSAGVIDDIEIALFLLLT